MRSFYQKYFEGYEESRVPNEKGKGLRIEHKYVGVYYYQDVTDFQRLIIRGLYVIILLGTLTLFFIASTQSIGCNRATYVTISQAVTFLTFIWFAWVLIQYVLAEQNMKIYTYKSTSPKLIRASLLVAGAFGLDTACVLIYVLLHAQDEPKKQLTCLLAYVLGGICLVVLSWLEKRIPYRRISNLENSA